MKFIFADSLDFVDPRYDFLEDRSPADRELYWDDQFPHEILGCAPYDGILVSRAVVGGHQFSGKYSDSQAMRFRRVGARAFLRFREEDYPGSAVFGDSGAFAYHKMHEPPYMPEDMVDFYGDAEFTHGCSVDHIIFDFKELDATKEEAYANSDEAVENLRRFEITLSNAGDFLKRSQRLGKRFTPLGTVQGWSPLSMAKAARELVRMGYSYLALGGMVPLGPNQIHAALDAVRDEIGADVSIHMLGFAKADQIEEFQRHGITSFDSTSPLLRAFKDGRRNYYLPGENNALKYYAAIRVPQSLENNSLRRLVKQGDYTQEDLQARERDALEALRAFDREEATVEDALEAVMAYTAPIAIQRDHGHTAAETRKLNQIRDRLHHTLNDRPWKSCSCPVCEQSSIEVIIFRASNRNKRRGIHNLGIYRQHINALNARGLNGTQTDLYSHQSAAE